MPTPASAFMPALSGAGDRVKISCRVQPRASRCLIVGMYGNAVKISLMSPPVDGRANAALCEFLADVLSLSKSSVALASGQTSRNKVVTACGVSAADAARLLSEASK